MSYNCVLFMAHCCSLLVQIEWQHKHKMDRNELCVQRPNYSSKILLHKEIMFFTKNPPSKYQINVLMIGFLIYSYYFRRNVSCVETREKYFKVQEYLRKLPFRHKCHGMFCKLVELCYSWLKWIRPL